LTKLKKNSSEGICGKVLNVRIKDNFTEELVLSTRRAQAGIAGLVAGDIAEGGDASKYAPDVVA
jgi:hypothetical protein